MPATPFNRPPRILPAPIRESVRIPSPPQLPQEPGAFSWMTILLPLGGILLMVVLMAAVGGGGGTMYLLSLPMMAGGYAVTYFAFRRQQQEYRSRIAEGKREYARRLSKTENHLYSLRDREQAVLRGVNPPLEECLDRALRRASSLGERRPADPDFLTLRLGTGLLPTAVTIDPGDQNAAAPELAPELETARRLVEKFSIVPDVPVLARILRSGAVGVAGARSDVLPVVRSILCHLCVHYWYSEVQTAALYGESTRTDWTWLSGVPHAAASFSWHNDGIRFSDPSGWSALRELEKELKRREQILDARKMIGDASPMPPLPCLMVVVDTFPLSFSHPGVDLMLKKGKELGVFALWLTPEESQIPGECGAVVAVRPGNLIYKESGAGAVALECRPDVCDAALADRIARALAAVDWAQKADLSQPPAMISFLKMLGASRADDLPVETWWNDGSPFGFLQAPIGKTSATSEFIFDLRDRDGSHGPHGLLGGMTGSGKSEVLKTLILALAAVHHPYDLNFALVDYKGGAAFNELARLPHTVGVMTDIESHASYAERVLMALGGELERRKRILERARSIFRFGRSHVDDYRAMRVKQPLPHLVIVFDEFAEFKSRHPEESKRLISIARLGRSLGVHLIMATQNIQAAIDPQILQNTNFRICLRTSQPEDSVQMIGIPDAIHLTRGRAYFYSTGRQLVQVAYCGGNCEHDDAVPDSPDRLQIVHPGGRQEVLPARDAAARRSAETTGGRNSTEAGAVVERLNTALQRLQLRNPPRVWSDPLPDRICLPDLFRDRLTGGWDGGTWHPCRRWEGAAGRDSTADPVLGIRDLPQKQEQPLFELALGEGGGHLLLFGSAASGKTTLLTTLVVSIARMYPPDRAQIHILDFGGQPRLRLLEAFPHVGSVITRSETERAERLLRYAQSELNRRDGLFRKAGVGTIADYNRAAGTEGLPELFFLIDNFLGLKRAFPPEFVNEIAALAAGSASSGIHLAAAAFLPSDLPADLQSNVHTQATLHQPTPAEYFGVVGMIGEARLQEDAGRPPRPGRGFLRGTPPVEFQAALPVAGAGDLEQMQNLIELGKQMRRAWRGPNPRSIESLPYSISQPKCIRANSPTAPNVPLGMDFETLLPVGLTPEADGPVFLVTGSAGQSGKTTAMLSWALGLAERRAPSDLQMIFLDFHARSFLPLRYLPHTLEYVHRPMDVEPCLKRLLAAVEQRAAAAEEAFQNDPDHDGDGAFPAAQLLYAVFIDDYDRFASRCESAPRLLARCLAAGGGAGLCMMIAGNASDLPKDYDDELMRKARRAGCGLLFSGNAAIDQFGNTKSPPYQPPAGLPPGRGYLIRKGTARIFQNYRYWEDGRTPAECLQERVAAIRAANSDSKIPAWPDTLQPKGG